MQEEYQAVRVGGMSESSYGISWGVFLFLELSGNSFCTRNLLYSAVYYLRDSM